MVDDVEPIDRETTSFHSFPCRPWNPRQGSPVVVRWTLCVLAWLGALPEDLVERDKEPVQEASLKRSVVRFANRRSASVARPLQVSEVEFRRPRNQRRCHRASRLCPHSSDCSNEPFRHSPLARPYDCSERAIRPMNPHWRYC
jgi:hypothetical protein